MDGETVNCRGKIAKFGGNVPSARLLRNRIASFLENRPQHSVSLPDVLQPKARIVVCRMVRAVCLQWDR